MSRNKVLYGNYSRYLNRKVHATDHCCPDSKVVCEGKRGPQGPIGETGPIGVVDSSGQAYEITMGSAVDVIGNGIQPFHPFTNSNYSSLQSATMPFYPITRNSKILGARIFFTQQTGSVVGGANQYMIFRYRNAQQGSQIPIVTPTANDFTLPNTGGVVTLFDGSNNVVSIINPPNNNYYVSIDITDKMNLTNDTLEAGDFVFACCKGEKVGYKAIGPILTLHLQTESS